MQPFFVGDVSGFAIWSTFQLHAAALTTLITVMRVW